MEYQFEVGDPVQLRTGGPEMTIDAIGDLNISGGRKDNVRCVWFDGTTRMAGVFSPESLVKLDRTTPNPATTHEMKKPPGFV